MEGMGGGRGRVRGDDCVNGFLLLVFSLEKVTNDIDLRNILKKKFIIKEKSDWFLL